MSLSEGGHEECPSQNEPWLSFTLFNLDYVIEETTAQPFNLDSLSSFTLRQEGLTLIQHGMPNLFLHFPFVVLNACTL